MTACQTFAPGGGWGGGASWSWEPLRGLVMGWTGEVEVAAGSMCVCDELGVEAGRGGVRERERWGGTGEWFGYKQPLEPGLEPPWTYKAACAGGS